MVEVEFRNVTITVANAKDAPNAYRRLCEYLAKEDLEYTTDTFVTYERDGGVSEERLTSDLWPVTKE